MKRLFVLVLAASLFFFSRTPLLASVGELENKLNPVGLDQPKEITYGFYLFSKREEKPASQARIFLCLDDQTNTLRCSPFDKSQSLERQIKTTLTSPAFTAEKTTKYHPYGETWFQEGSEDIAPKYNGQELDQESDFYYFNARHYDPELARFVTADVVVDGEDTTAGWNRYMYVHGNPIKYKDPTGHELVRIKLTPDQKEYVKLGNGKTMKKGFVIDKKLVPNVEKLFGDLKEKGYEVKVNSAFRTSREQNTQLTRNNPQAKRGTSSHEAGLGLDLSVRKKGSKNWTPITNDKQANQSALDAGFRSGKSFDDPPHVDAGSRNQKQLGYKNRSEAVKENQTHYKYKIRSPIKDVQINMEKKKTYSGVRG